jgi:CheY-like chemotaxis protein
LPAGSVVAKRGIGHPDSGEERSMTQLPTCVLVVEDDEPSREIIDLVFAQEPGIYYSLAAGGANAIAKLSDGPPDVVLTDLIMPRVSGVEVVSFARSRYPGIPIIAYSADHTADTATPMREIGKEMVYFLRKPFDLTVLVALVLQLGTDRAWRAALPENG